MRLLVSDTSCLIDLQRGGLLQVFPELPYEFVIPDVVLYDELLTFSEAEKTFLEKNMTVASLDPAGVDRVQEVLTAMPALSTYDGFTFVVAEQRPGCILLTGDAKLRAWAQSVTVEVHGVLWVVDQLGMYGKTSAKMRLSALKTWHDHPASRLPKKTLGRMIDELTRGA